MWVRSKHTKKKSGSVERMRISEQLEGPLACLIAEHTNGFGFELEFGADRLLGLGFISVPVRRIDEAESDVALKVPCSLAMRERLAAEIAADAEAPSVKLDEWLGRVSVQLHYSEWARIPAAIQALLNRGYRVRLKMHGDPLFEPGEVFSFDAIEAKIVATLRRHYAECGSAWHKVYMVDRNPHVFLKHYNWHTPAGKALCTEMRAELRPDKPEAKKLDRYAWSWYDAVCRQNKILHHGGWSSFVPTGIDTLTPIPLVSPSSSASTTTTAAAASSSASRDAEPTPIHLPLFEGAKKRALSPPADRAGTTTTAATTTAPLDANESAKEESGDDEITECMVCFERPPSTLVLPCMHVVVCAQCSQHLRSQRDAKTCLRCRRPIERVLCDEE